MMLSRYVMPALAIGMMELGASGVAAQDYPNKVIRIVTSGAGGPGDLMARRIGQGISGPLGQPVIVDNRVPIIAYDVVGKSPPDGYTLYYAGAYFTTLKLLQPVAFDPVRDFAPITQTETFPCIMAVHPSFPVKSIKELIALAKAKPGQINFSSAPKGTASDLAAILLTSMSGIDMTTVYHKSDPEAARAVLSGEIPMTILVVPSVRPYIASGKLRAVAVTSAQPSSLAPGVPTAATSGLPGFEMAIINGMYAPGKTPAAIINRLNQEIVRVLNEPKVKQDIVNAGAEVVANSPSEFAAVIKADIAKWTDTFKKAGIPPPQ